MSPGRPPVPVLPPRTRRAADRGSVTAEVALLLPVVLLVVGAIVFAAVAGTAQMRCQDAARAVVRALAIGSEPAVAVEMATRLAGEGAVVEVSGSDGWVEVEVSRLLELPGGGSVRVSGTASAPVEPGVAR